jgi:acetyl esterase/lipase
LAACLVVFLLWKGPALAQPEKASLQAESQKTKTSELQPPAGVAYDKDVIYGTPDPKTKLMLDVARPKNLAGPLPTVILIHGAGLTRGRKELRPHAFALAQKGYVAVLVAYRYEPHHRFPIPLGDAMSALRWLQKNAGKYQVDTARISVVGHSTGGGIGCLMAMNSAKGEIQAVVSYSTPTDLARWHATCLKNDPARWSNPLIREALEIAFDGPPWKKTAQVYAQASPLTHAGKHAPPTLLLCGTADQVVPHEQSFLLAEKLDAAGATVELRLLIGAPHDFEGVHQQQAINATIRFLDQHLKNAKPK